MSFRFVLKSVTLNDLERRNGRYSALFQLTIKRVTEIITRGVNTMNNVVENMKRRDSSGRDLLKLGTRSEPDQLGFERIEQQAS